LIWFGSEAAEPFSNHAEPGPRGQVIQFMGCGGGRKMVDIWDDRVHASGTEIVVDARAVALIEDDARIAVAIMRIDNQDRFFMVRKGVVLVTGGFALNPVQTGSRGNREFRPDQEFLRYCTARQAH
jgi:aspartate oxidase